MPSTGTLALPCVGIGQVDENRLRIATTENGVVSIRYLELGPDSSS